MSNKEENIIAAINGMLEEHSLKLELQHQGSRRLIYLYNNGNCERCVTSFSTKKEFSEYIDGFLTALNLVTTHHSSNENYVMKIKPPNRPTARNTEERMPYAILWNGKWKHVFFEVHHSSNVSELFIKTTRRKVMYIEILPTPHGYRWKEKKFED